ncbi:hypothetical protein [Burkholderia anthina]|uniref:hypothetical protein n=1 Tax=Burkholderia anthina TaxID=179879 RepID=UPI001FB6B886|nr:hypothetical protein [Burkholderia anthina]
MPIAVVSSRGWQILDHWAFESPAHLRALEAVGEVILLGRLLEQRRQCLTEQDILALHEIPTALA